MTWYGRGERGVGTWYGRGERGVGKMPMFCGSEPETSHWQNIT